MSFFFVDDQFTVNAKVTALIAEHGSAGVAAVGLWTLTGSLLRQSGSDGVVRAPDVLRAVLDKRQGAKLAGLLVRVGLWHSHGHTCPVCPPVEAGAWLFHQWFQFGYSTGAKARQAVDRRKELKNSDIVEAVWARDCPGGVGWCRYCGRSVKRSDHKSPNRPTLDHVIPGLARGVANLVVACLPCNQTKAQRTPEQAGMALLPAPESSAELTSELIGSESDSGWSPTGVGDGAGAGPDLGSDLGPDLGRGWVGAPAGDAPAVATPDREGSPFRGHTGPWVAPSPDSLCSTHGSHLPCARCSADRYADEVNA